MHSTQLPILRFLYLTALLAALALVAPSGARADDLVLQSKLCTVHYNDPDQLEKFAGKIRPSLVTRTLNQVLVASGGGHQSQPEFGEFLDELFKRVQLILDMPMPKLRVEIQLHKNVKEVLAAYAELTGGPGDAPAFYWKKSNTIHIQAERLTIGMLAHEMGHAVLDHYFAIQPPVKIAEMLCQYVDKEVTAANF